MDNEDQRTFWSDNVGHLWVDLREAMDRKLAPVLETVLERAAIAEGDHVLDIGCGAGTSSLEAAQRAGPSGQVIGADISQTLLTEARRRGADYPNVRFELCDAQTYAFAPQSTDLIMSRFGVMFFANSVDAFANMSKALKTNGRIVFSTWGAIPANPFFTLPARISKTVLGPMEKSDPDGPGPFAFREIDRVTKIMRAAGLTNIEAEPVEMYLTPPGNVADLANLMCQIGPAHGALKHYNPDAAQRQSLVDALTDALTPYATPDGIRIPALINLFSATRP